MNDAGNHGGSAEGETSPALVFISPKLRSISQGVECPTAPLSGGLGFYTKIDQSDVAPTLAGLLGVPVPRNNLGVFIPDLLRFWTQGMLPQSDPSSRVVDGLPLQGTAFGS